VLTGCLLLSACGEKKSTEEAETVVPVFNGDSALHFVQKQVSFGPRIPNSTAHREAGDYLVQALKKYGARVTVQEFQATTYDGEKINLRNIVGAFRPDVQKRILLAAHWDTRPKASKDPVAPDKTFDGANDGASGVGVLLEIARNLSTPPNVGVDIIFFDGEDWGEEDGTTPLPTGLDSWWCLGSQHWSKKTHVPGYKAYFGILLDMVGGRNAQFFHEGTSVFYAQRVVDKVWSVAARLGYQSTFISQQQAPITDDHLFVNQLAEIPMINITAYDQGTGYFGTYHHTQADNMGLISKETLSKVGNVVLQVVYREE